VKPDDPQLPADEPAKPHPANFLPVKTPAASSRTTKTAPAKSAQTAKKAPEPVRKIPEQVKKIPEQVKKIPEPVKPATTPVSSRPVRTLIPKWTPPAMNRTSNSGGSSLSQTPSPRIGLRVGLSRNFRPPKPLHASYKSPD
jgi:hypothetical protein